MTVRKAHREGKAREAWRDLKVAGTCRMPSLRPGTAPRAREIVTNKVPVAPATSGSGLLQWAGVGM